MSHIVAGAVFLSAGRTCSFGAAVRRRRSTCDVLFCGCDGVGMRRSAFPRRRSHRVKYGITHDRVPSGRTDKTASTMLPSILSVPALRLPSACRRACRRVEGQAKRRLKVRPRKSCYNVLGFVATLVIRISTLHGYAMEKSLGVGVVGLHEGRTMLVALGRTRHCHAVAGCDLRKEKIA